MKKKENRKLNNMALFVVVVMILFMSIVSIELITILYRDREAAKITPVTNDIKKDEQNNTYDISNLTFTDLTLTNEATSLQDMCSNGCNIKISMYGMDYYYIIEYTDGSYIMNIVKDNTRLLSDKNLGTSIANAYFRNYMNYIMFYNIIEDTNFRYDYANVIDNRASLDEFSSLDSGEMEFTEEGIIYYYDVCENNGDGANNAKKVKAIRLPFSLTPSVISTEYVDYSWCE